VERSPNDTGTEAPAGKAAATKRPGKAPARTTVKTLVEAPVKAPVKPTVKASDKTPRTPPEQAPDQTAATPQPGPGERPTLKTISRLSGLAVPTVSRALGNAPDIGQRTKDRVQAIARQIGYRPNRAGLRLRTGKTQVISLVIATDHDVMNQTARLIGSIAQGLRGTSYHLNVNPAFPDDPMLPVRYIVESGSADGIIMNTTLPDDPRIHFLNEAGFPFVTHGRSSMAASHAYFDFDHYTMGQLTVGELVERTRSSILLIPPPQHQNYAQDLMRGAREKAAKCGVTLRIFGDIHSETPLERIEQALVRHMQQFPDTDAILCASTTAALGAIATADQLGLEIGRDIDVCTREVIPLLGRFRPGILTVDEDVTRAGLFLARAILHRIEHPVEPPLQELEIPTKVNVFD
jgi:LacI family transcriptional regulator